MEDSKVMFVSEVSNWMFIKTPVESLLDTYGIALENCDVLFDGDTIEIVLKILSYTPERHAMVTNGVYSQRLTLFFEFDVNTFEINQLLRILDKKVQSLFF